MPTVDSIVERDEGDNRLTANIFLIVITVQVILCEANVIRGLWFKEASHATDGMGIPFRSFSRSRYCFCHCFGCKQSDGSQREK